MVLAIDHENFNLLEKSKNEFHKELKKNGYREIRFTSGRRLDYLAFKYLLIKYKGDFLGYVILVKSLNKTSKIESWILANIEVKSKYRGRGVGSVILEKVHQLFLSELSTNSYIVTLNSYVMYKMIVREYIKGNVDFYCLINTQYPVEEMKEEERYLEQLFLDNPEIHADMIVSFDKEETERVKSLYFKSN